MTKMAMIRAIILGGQAVVLRLLNEVDLDNGFAFNR
jgi:hypothetical protein